MKTNSYPRNKTVSICFVGKFFIIIYKNLYRTVGYGKWCLTVSSVLLVPLSISPSIAPSISSRTLMYTLACVSFKRAHYAAQAFISSLLSQLASTSRCLSSVVRSFIDLQLNGSPERFHTGLANTFKSIRIQCMSIFKHFIFIMTMNLMAIKDI